MIPDNSDRQLFALVGRVARGFTAAAWLGITLANFSHPAAATETAIHPLDPLTPVEYRTVVRVLQDSGHTDEDSLFPLITLDEPDKSEVLGWKAGGLAVRRAFVVVMKERRTFEAVIDLSGRQVFSWREVRGVQPGILLTEEWSAAQELVRAHEPWRAAIRKRGIGDVDQVLPVPLTVGYFGESREKIDRLVKVLSFDARDTDNYWGRPIEGLIAVVDLHSKQVVELVDTGTVPIPDGEVDLAGDTVGMLRLPPNSVSLVQPDGPSFQIDGHFVYWQKWSFHWRIDPRLGPVVSLVRYQDAGRQRSILYQGSLSEMFVPYTDPSPGWYFRAYMDAGEYGIGQLLSRLEPELDCPANATFLSTFLADEWGNAQPRPQAACLFERSSGEVAWRHHEAATGHTEARKATDLVFRVVPAVGNYDYVLDWVFRQDGSIHFSVGATGVPQVKAVAAEPEGARSSSDETFGHLVAENTLAIHHSHFFSYRLDLDVDGRDNSFLLERLKTVPVEGGGPRKSTWVVDPQIASTEKTARLRINLERPALWRVINDDKHSRLGHPVSYQLVPGTNAVSLLDPDEWLQQRAGFTDFHLWVTPYDRAERYAAGAYPNQSRGGEGLPRWSGENRPIRDTDLVLWYTLGMHHVVRTEDWPVLPTTWTGFELRPFDFFRRNPALDLPDGRDDNRR